MSIILATLLISFLATYFFTPKLIIFLEKIGLVGTDVQKSGKPKVAEMGGPAITFGFLAGMFFYIFITTFIFNENTYLVDLFAAITTITIVSVIGMFDDLSRLFKIYQIKMDRWGSEKRIGLKQWQKPLLTLPAAIPLMAILAGDHTIAIPVLGVTNIGILYPLLLIPIGVVGAANATNMLAGMNGLEAGLGAVLLGSLGIFSYLTGNIAGAMIALTLAATMLAFLRYNWYPARIMPGDSLSYLIGVAAATVAIISNIEKFAVFLFIPWFIELLLKTKSKFKAENFGIIQADGTLKAPYEKGTYSLTHIVMKFGRFKEWQVVSIIIGFEILLALIGFAVFYFGIFEAYL